jgi:hypothetical protein
VVAFICGLSAFASKQLEPTDPPLRRTRVGVTWLWAIKIAVWLTIVATMGLLALVLAGVIKDMLPHSNEASAFGSAFESQLERLEHLAKAVIDRPQQLLIPCHFLLVCAPYAFACGLIAALIAPRRLAAIATCLLLTAGLAIWWVPSWVVGDISWWQFVSVPLLLLCWSRHFLGSRMHEQGSRSSPWTGLAACGLSAAALTGANLWYRVLQVPKVGQPFDVQAYVAAAPTEEQNKAGRLVEALRHELRGWQQTVREQVGPLTRASASRFL